MTAAPIKLFGKLPSFGYFDEPKNGGRRFNLISELSFAEFNQAIKACERVEKFNRSIFIVSSVKRACVRYWKTKKQIETEIKSNVGKRERWIEISYSLLELGNALYTFSQHQIRSATKEFGRNSAEFRKVKSLLETGSQYSAVIEAVRHYCVHVDFIEVHGRVESKNGGTHIEPPYILRDDLISAFRRKNFVRGVLQTRAKFISCDDEVKNWRRSFDEMVGAIYSIRAQPVLQHAATLSELLSRAKIPNGAKISIMHAGKHLERDRYSVRYVDVFPASVELILNSNITGQSSKP
ncbi:MAG: hypothetical protein ACU0DI_01065 [Paracoccaceae bacterium]